MSVVSLTGGPVVAEVNRDVVKELERLLAEARDGKILALAYATALRGGNYACGWTTAPDGVSLGSGILGLSYRFGQASWE